MRIDRQQVVRLLRERGDPGHADDAAQHLPDSLDLDDDQPQQLSSTTFAPSRNWARFIRNCDHAVFSQTEPRKGEQ